MKSSLTRILFGFILIFSILTATASASERSVATEVLAANAKSYNRFTEARFSGAFKREMGAETACVDNIIKGIKTSPEISQEETFDVLLHIYIVFPFDYIIESSRDKKELVQKEAALLIRESKTIGRGATSPREHVFVTALRAQAQTMRILARIKGNVDFCQIEKNIGDIYTVDTVGIAFDDAFPGSWGPKLARSKGYKVASKKINNAVFRITMMKPRFPEKMIDKFVYPPSLGMMIAWDKNVSETRTQQYLSKKTLLQVFKNG